MLFLPYRFSLSVYIVVCSQSGEGTELNALFPTIPTTLDDIRLHNTEMNFVHTYPSAGAYTVGYPQGRLYSLNHPQDGTKS